MHWKTINPWLLLLWLAPTGLWGQDTPHYRLEIDTIPYRPLDRGVLIWSEQTAEPSIREALAMPFEFFFFDRSVPNVEPFPQGNLYLGSPIDNFYPFKPQLISRPYSELRYQIEGEALCRSRILKIEWHRFGLACDSLDRYEISFQMWLHEHTNTMTLHHGPQLAPAGFEAWAEEQLCHMWSPSLAGFRSVGSEYGLLLEYPGWRATIYHDDNQLSYLEGTRGDLYVDQYATPLAPLPPDQVLRFIPLDQPAPTQDLKVFPNPFQDVLQVRRLGSCSSLRFALYDLLGHCLADFSCDEPEFTIDTRRFAPGMYFLVAMQPNGRIVQRWKMWKQ